MEQRIRSSRRWIPLAVLVVGLMSTGIAGWFAWRAHHALERARMGRSASQVRAEISKRIETSVAMLRATAGLFAASEYVSLGEFHQFVARLELSTAYPGSLGVGYVQYSRDAAAAAQRIAREHGREVEIARTTGEEVYQVVYFEPRTVENIRVIGWELSTDPVRLAAMERARDMGAPTVAAPLGLMQDGFATTGLVVVVPVYSGGGVPQSQEARRRDLTGLVYSTFRARDLFEAVSADSGVAASVEFALYDGAEEREDRLIHRTGGMAGVYANAERDGMVSHGSVEVCGRVWTIVAAPGKGFGVGARQDMTGYALAGGTLIGALLFVLAQSQLRWAERSQRIAANLTESEARKGAILESAIDAVISVDEAGRVIEWNSAAEVIFGWKREEAIGRALGELIVPGEEEHALTALAGRSLQSAPGRRLEVTAVRKDGSRVPVEVSICRVGVDGPARHTGFFRDISERLRAEQRQKLLTRELDHRVKNNLATVLAIVSETGRRCGSVGCVVEGVMGRVRALATLHEMLAAEKWEGAVLGEIVKRTLSPYISEERDRVEVEGEEVYVPGRTAPALCMALHELATNAAKYGALSNSVGRVRVSWHREGELLELVWRERGGPPPRLPATRGFGTELIEDGVAFETGGSSVLVFDAEGVECRIVLSLGGVQRG